MATTDPRYAKWYGCGIVDADKALIDVPPPSPGLGPIANDDAAMMPGQRSVSRLGAAGGGEMLTIEARSKGFWPA